MLSLSLLSTLLLSSCVLAAPIEKRTPPGIPTTAAAKTALAGLTVAAQGPQVSFSSPNDVILLSGSYCCLKTAVVFILLGVL